MCRPQSSRHIPRAVHKVVGTFHVPSTWNPSQRLILNGTAERACTFFRLCLNDVAATHCVAYKTDDKQH
jgi:hypothetical protein